MRWYVTRRTAHKSVGTLALGLSRAVENVRRVKEILSGNVIVPSPPHQDV
jgi:hypothetical protein